MHKSLSLLFFFLACCGQPAEKEIPAVPVDYAKLKVSIKEKQHELRKDYQAADAVKKKAVINAARDYLFETITNDLFNQWYGTPWAFYGCTKEPKKGAIACGYFVNTVLGDAGFNIPVTKWSQLASETFIVKLTPDVKRFHKKPIAQVKEYLSGRGDGLYLVGLDCHVGFIYVKGNAVKFVHSNYYQKEFGVMAENLDTKNPLNDSKYRVLGKLLDDQMVENWLTGTAYK